MARSITVFRSRLHPGAPAGYSAVAADLEDRARRAHGFVEFKEFVAADGERLALAIFENDEAEARWRDDAVHRAAQEQGRRDFYTEYDVAVCDERRRRRWSAGDAGTSAR